MSACIAVASPGVAALLVIVRARVYNAPPPVDRHERAVRGRTNITVDEEHANVGVSGVRSGDRAGGRFGSG